MEFALVGVANPDTLSGLLLESSKDQQEVTDQLGYQVREAVEVLVQAFDHIDAESGRILLAKVDEKTLYDGALTVMMRLVFLFSAEERGLLLLGDPLYDQNYAVSTLSELLRERADQHGEEVLERRHDAWCRLLATFRAVHAGVEHEAMRLPPYGGSLFDPDRYPFLEGRSVDGSWQSTVAKPLVINNRVVLHLLEALQMLRVTVPGGGPPEARRLSFSSLDIEQIGHVYEGLLDHTAKRADEPMLGLAGSKAKEPEVPLHTLEDLARKGTAALVEYLRKETSRSEKALRRLIEASPETDEHALLIACEQDETISQHVKPFASLLRRDSFGQLVVIRTGSIYVTAGSDRRSTGTHYTPRSLTEPIVKYTLEPLVYVGPAERLPPAGWMLKSPKEILALKVCDMAMGSGAFLVEACRYLADRLVEAWENAEREHPGSFVVTPDGELSTRSPTERLIPADSAERVALARRYVVDRCLYGVDINPMAVEMAKLSLWLITLQRDRPFSFLDHAFKCGDSLLGVSAFKQVENFSLQPGARQITFATARLGRQLAEAATKRRTLAELPSNDLTQISSKSHLHVEAEAETAAIRALSDLLIGFELRGLVGVAYDEQRTIVADHAERAIRQPLLEFQRYARGQVRGLRTFHWCLEFPEVFTEGGFDAFIGNPPFVGGRRIRETFGDLYRDAINLVFPGSSGNADVSAFFFRRAFELLENGGCFGLIATNTIAQGDTRESGLQRIAAGGGTIFRGVTDRAWPGSASVTVCEIYVQKGPRFLVSYLNGLPVDSISSFLLSGEAAEPPRRLLSNEGNSFQGSVVVGAGFVLQPDEAARILNENPQNANVIIPYINGEDVNNRPDVSPSRFVINFYDWPLDTARSYPEAFKIVDDIVRPVREQVRREAHRKYWWHYGDKRPALYRAVASLERVLVCVAISKYLNFVFIEKGYVYNQRLFVFAFDDAARFGCLQSSFHELWTRKYASTLDTRLSYVSSSCFDTFPFPTDISSVRDIGERYHEFRRRAMLSRREGLTRIYNRFHDRDEKSEDIAQLRALHVEMDQAVAAAYDRSEVDLGHDFHETKEGIRYTLSESARRTVLDCLLALNHEGYAEEVKAGLHNKGAKKTPHGRPKPKDNAALKLFGRLRYEPTAATSHETD